jgi:murein DD-endopeptidase MepM/ murein hydrolase activator NlpD
LKGSPVSSGPITPIGGSSDFDSAPAESSKMASRTQAPKATGDRTDTKVLASTSPASAKTPDSDVTSHASTAARKRADAGAKHHDAAKDDTVVASNARSRGTPAWYTPAQSQPSSDDEATVQPQAVQQQQRVPGSGRFVWPVSGRVIAQFGTSANGERNDGINIAAKAGDPIRAAASGVVTYAGNQLRSYGNLLLIKHDDGYVTAYAHAQSLNVQKGDHVLKGQVIGTVGQTGDVTQPQLHFEIRNGVQPVNPMALLVASR